MDTTLYRVIILPDTHIPWQDTKSLAAVENFMADYKWDEYVHLGDLLDFDMISKFNADLLRQLETRRILKDYDIANDFLDRHQSIVRKNNKEAKFTLLQGNHEDRMERFLDKAPQFAGLLEVETNLRLAERGVKWVRSWTDGDLHRIGKLNFSHGLYTNKYHASKMVDSFGVSVVYGHTHDSQSYGKSMRGKNKVIKATSLGFLADENKLKYMRNRPNNWSQAFGIADIRPDGNFNLLVVDIINHQFSVNGRIYKP